MKMDINRVNLLERDIEDWLYENPTILNVTWRKNPIVRWIGRQYTLPSGIADLIGVCENGMLVVVEVKNVAINKAAVLQVCRYADDLKYIVSGRSGYPHIRPDNNEPFIQMVLVGPGIDDQTFTEARAVGVRVFQFSATLHLDVSSLTWTSEHFGSVRAQQELIAARPEWDMYGLTIGESLDQDRHIETETFVEHAEISTEADEQLKAITKYAREYHRLEVEAKENDDADDDGVSLED